MEGQTELEEHNLVVCAWRLDTKIDADKYIDALDKLIYLAKKEVLDDIEENLDYYKTVFIKDKFVDIKKKHLNTQDTENKNKEGENEKI